MSKRIISLILSLLIAFSCLSVGMVSAGAESVAKITFDGVVYTANVGSTITFTAKCSAPEKLSGMAGKFYYDPKVLKGVSCADFMAPSQPYYDCYPVLSKDGNNSAGGDDDLGIYAFAAIALDSSSYFDFTNGGVICTYNFTVISGGETEVSFDLTEAFYKYSSTTDYDYIEKNNLKPDVTTSPQKTINAGSTIKDKLSDDYLKLSCTLTGATPSTSVETEDFNVINDVDVFSVKTSSYGRLNLYFKHTVSKDNGAWKVTVRKKTGSTLEYVTGKTIYISDSSSVTIPFVGAVSGEYFIYVESADKGKGVNNYAYTIETSFSKSSYYEKEVNNTSSNATTISVNKDYSGVIGYSSDLDWYKVTMPTAGRLSLSFAYSKASVSDRWVVTLYKYSSGKLSKVSSKTVYAKSTSPAKFSSISVKSKGVYYVKVDDHSSYDAIGRTYKLNATFALDSMSSLKATGYTGAFKLTWKKSNSNYYAVQYKKGSSYVTLKKTSLDYYKKTGLSRRKTYTLRVRAYKKVGSTTYYGAWKTISVKTK